MTERSVAYVITSRTCKLAKSLSAASHLIMDRRSPCIRFSSQLMWLDEPFDAIPVGNLMFMTVAAGQTVDDPAVNVEIPANMQRGDTATRWRHMTDERSRTNWIGTSSSRVHMGLGRLTTLSCSRRDLQTRRDKMI